MNTRRVLVPALSSLLVCLGGVVAAFAQESTFRVVLPCTADGWYLHQGDCEAEEIHVPDGRPIYALLVSGFHQNRNLDMFHWYNLAKCLQERGAYVHYAWWNNLLAPYMAKPLHYDGSVPSTAATPHHDLFGFFYGWNGDQFPNKAIPADDHQFQEDAVRLLSEIHEHSPGAAIVLVGHSMGGAAVVRLAADPRLHDVEIALLAPIDPVGNRTCLPSSAIYSYGGWYCKGYDTFKRYYAARKDDRYEWPDKRALGVNVKYLYHRWQTESFPPFDGFPLAPWQTETFVFDPPRQILQDIGAGNTNVQFVVDTSLDSGYDVHPNNSGGWMDGHGEIVGFRGVKPWSEESWPIGLDAPPNWPSLDRERSYDDEADRAKVRDLRVSLLKTWEKDPEYFDFHWAPEKPKYQYCKTRDLEGVDCSYCMVSGDLCRVLDFAVPGAVNRPPTADAGSDQTVSAGDECMGQVVLDGSGSIDPDGDSLLYTWMWNDGAGEANGPNPIIALPLGVTEITLVVNDGTVDSEPESVVITVVDDAPPVIQLEGATELALECGVEAWEDPGASATDLCDTDVAVSVGGDIVNPDVPGVYRTTYDAEDASGNAASQVIRTVIVQDRIQPTVWSVSVDPSALWPPDHAMVPVQVSVVAHDVCDPDPVIYLVSVTSSEPDDSPGGGDGETTGDIQDAGIGTEDYHILLRAERLGGGDGRVYTLSYAVTDASGNTTGFEAFVTVAHDGGKQPMRRSPGKERNKAGP